ncbi:hypothetical protein HYALB_00012234 [Hymenoscyphus albidus]|uniref:SAP domain-containing protein n=1 Tax=Hymenoscyphus albidus TaxID=595503 RepID=A0A9N9LNF2_9HELO|nr:hypothetical protein HYALB_00012234 [Hymenoscyphus albidus]
MPRAKRPLSELDPNASKSTARPAKHAKITDEREDYSKLKKAELVQLARDRNLPCGGNKDDLKQRLQDCDDKENDEEDDEEEDEEDEVNEEEEQQELAKTGDFFNQPIDYTTKDNSKLRFLLSDREYFPGALLRDGMTCEEMIALLQRTPANYESFTIEEISEKLKARGLRHASDCAKQVKIDRLKLNDLVDRNTADYKDTQLYVSLDVFNMMIASDIKKQEEAKNTNPFSSWSIKRLQKYLTTNKLSPNGSKEVLTKRAAKHDEKEMSKKIKGLQVKRDSAIIKLEASIGHPLESFTIFNGRESQYEGLDHQILSKGKKPAQSKKPVCNYDWSGSHWASRTEREIQKICERRGMPGRGAAPKAAQLKWLDTGVVEYADFYVAGLTIMCEERGIKHKYEPKKVDLIALLEEDDERE